MTIYTMDLVILKKLYLMSNQGVRELQIYSIYKIDIKRELDVVQNICVTSVRSFAEIEMRQDK